MSIPFTSQELKRAWRQLSKNSKPSRDGQRENAQRLLLFYAVECGLKAVWLKRNSRTLFADEDIKQTGHDLAKVLSRLRAGGQLGLPTNIELSAASAAGKRIPRNGGIDILHQAWRYGGQCRSPNDDVACERKLEQVLEWISGELQ